MTAGPATKASFLTTYLRPLETVLTDPAIVEIAINPDGRVLGRNPGCRAHGAPDRDHVWPRAGPRSGDLYRERTQGQISEKKPLVSGKIAAVDGKPIRAQVVYMPIVEGRPSITLRRYCEEAVSLDRIELLHGALVDLDAERQEKARRVMDLTDAGRIL